MNKLQGLEYKIVMNGLTASNGATVGGTAVPSFDTVNWQEYTLALIGTTSDNATNNPSVLKIQSSDTDGQTHASHTNWADVTALVGDGTGGFTVPSSPTATTTAVYAAINVKCGGAKRRYHRLVVSPLTTQTFTALVIAKRKEHANSTTEANAAVYPAG